MSPRPPSTRPTSHADRAEAPALRPRDLELPHGRLRVVDSGPRAGELTPVVLVHGLAGTHAYWLPVARRLARTRRVLAPDLPGFGASRPLGRGWSLEEAADALADALARLGVQRAALVGHSMGGALVATVALRRPELVDRLVLVAPIGFRPMRPRPSWRLGPLLHLRRALRPLGLLLSRHAPTAQRLIGGVVENPTRVDLELARALIDGSLRARRTGQAGLDVIARDLAEHAGEIRVPTLVVWGRRDRAVSVSHLGAVVDAVPGARPLVLDGSGHLPMLDEPDALAAALSRFLDATDAHVDGT